MLHEDHYPYIRGIIASCGFKRLNHSLNLARKQRGLSNNNLPS